MSEEEEIERPLNKLNDWLMKYESKFNMRKGHRVIKLPVEDYIEMWEKEELPSVFAETKKHRFRTSRKKSSNTRKEWKRTLRGSIETHAEITWLQRATSYIQKKNERVDSDVARAAQKVQEAIELCSHYEDNYQIARRLVNRLNQMQNLKIANALSKCKKEKLMREILSVMLILRRRKKYSLESTTEPSHSPTEGSEKEKDKEEEEEEIIQTFGERHDSYGRPLAMLASRMLWNSTNSKNDMEIEEKVIRDLQAFCSEPYLQKIAEKNRESGIDMLVSSSSFFLKKQKEEVSVAASSSPPPPDVTTKTTTLKKQPFVYNFSKYCSTKHFQNRVKANRFFERATKIAREKFIDKERSEILKEQSEIENQYKDNDDEDNLSNPPGLFEAKQDNDDMSTLIPITSSDFISPCDDEEAQSPALPPGLSLSQDSTFRTKEEENLFDSPQTKPPMEPSEFDDNPPGLMIG